MLITTKASESVFRPEMHRLEPDNQIQLVTRWYQICALWIWNYGFGLPKWFTEVYPDILFQGGLA